MIDLVLLLHRKISKRGSGRHWMDVVERRKREIRGNSE